MLSQSNASCTCNHQNHTGTVVTQFQIQDWPADGQVTQSEIIVQVIASVIKVQHSAGGGTVVVHCRYTIILVLLHVLVKLTQTWAVNMIRICKSYDSG